MRYLHFLPHLAIVTLHLFLATDAMLGNFNANDCPRERASSLTVQVYLSVSSLASVSSDNSNDVVERQLELNWKYNASKNDDWVALYDTDPSNSTNLPDPLEMVWVVDHPEEFYRTSIQFPRYNFTEDDLQESRCLDFWIGYGRNDSLLTSSCLKIRPQWMWELRKTIGNTPLSNLMIPGTHNAGSFDRYRGYKSENVFVRYNIYQEENIGTQLMFGIRHFDFRIGYYKNNKFPYWLNHAHVKHNPFAFAIEHIKTFVQHSKDILFLDFHRFPIGFQNRIDRHAEFMNYLLAELGDYLVPRSVGYSVRPNELWSINKTIVLFYSNDNYLFNSLFWPGLPQIWANSNRISRVKSHFRRYISEPRRDLMWSAMAQMTPTIWDAISNPKGSLRILADQVNRPVTHWFRDGWWREANIVATDFFLGNNIIEVAIEANKDRVSCRRNQTNMYNT